MTTLLIRLSGPMQSWGTADSRFATFRDTAREPSKSGVVGLIAAALGYPRAATVDDVAALRMGVRVDQPGEMLCDFQAIQDALVASGKKRRNAISYRWYLSDARFLVGLEGERGFLAHIQWALNNPVWLLYLGRKKFVPGEPLALGDGLRDQPLLEALAGHPWLGIDERRRPETVRVVYQVHRGEGDQRRDQPRGTIEERRFAPRWVTAIDIPTPGSSKEDE